MAEVEVETAGSHEQVLVGDCENSNRRQRQQIRSPDTHGGGDHAVSVPAQRPHRAVKEDAVDLKRHGVGRGIAVGDGAPRGEGGV